MPYIKFNDRYELFDPSFRGPANPGELNYVLTRTILEYLDKDQVNYTKYNEIMGVLTCIQHELYRRMIAPYEDMKIKENGDVY